MNQTRIIPSERSNFTGDGLTTNFLGQAEDQGLVTNLQLWFTSSRNVSSIHIFAQAPQIFVLASNLIVASELRTAISAGLLRRCERH